MHVASLVLNDPMHYVYYDILFTIFLFPVAEIVCGKPEVPAHGYIQHSTDFTYPNTVEFACADGYRMKGQRLMRCEISAEWSGTPPQCALAGNLYSLHHTFPH